MKKEGVITSSFFGSITPVFAIMGSAIILIGGIVSNPTYVPIFILFCFVVCFIGYKYYEKKITA
jgi:APA family basic amino acid/polyamine antiporter